MDDLLLLTPTKKSHIAKLEDLLKALLNKKAHVLKAQPHKHFILGSSPNVNSKLLTHILTNEHTHPTTYG